jgi:hypothetical protein
METVVKQINLLQRKNKQEKAVGLLAGLFGCWHEELSRPFTSADESYRVCLHCGARRRFDPNTLKTYGKFYFSPIVAEIRRSEYSTAPHSLRA